MPEDKIIQNLRVGKLITAMSNYGAALLFIIAYSLNDNIWLLITAMILIVTGTVVIIYFGKTEKKLKSTINKK